MKGIDVSNSSTAIVEYFSRDTINRFIAHHFSVHGLTEEVREDLMAIAVLDHDLFLEMICDFLDKEMV